MLVVCEYCEALQPIAATLQYCDFNVKFWAPDRKSLLDMYDEIRPPLLLYYSEPVNKSIQNLESYISSCLYLRLPYLNLPNPVQLLGLAEEKYKSDVVILDRQLPQEVKDIAAHLFKEGFQVKVFAENKTGSPFQLGALASLKEYSTTIASSKIVLDLTSRWGLNCEMNGKIGLLGQNSLDFAPETEYNTITRPARLCRTLMDNPKIYDRLVKEGKEKLLDNTFFQYVAAVLSRLGFLEESSKVLDVFDEKVRGLLR